MERFLWVCLGGALGSGARYLAWSALTTRLGAGFPWGTLAVNLGGSFLLSALMVIGLAGEYVSRAWWLSLTTGLMGGFTTYSTFNYETLALFRDGRVGAAAAYVVLTLLLCLAGGVLGHLAGRALVG